MKRNDKEKQTEQIAKVIEICSARCKTLAREKQVDRAESSMNKAAVKQLRQQLKLTPKKVFEVVVFSTMSSGKSTFINALIGSELLPARNEACTSRTIAIWDNDKVQKPVLHIERGLGNRQKIRNCTQESVAAATSENTDAITDIVIETNILGIRNIKKSLLIVDTPGVNNCFDLEHTVITKEYLQAHNPDLLIYVVNAAQIGTNDAVKSLAYLKTVCEQNPQTQILFVMNKADVLDDELQPIEDTIAYCRMSLIECGFQTERILLVSSDAALLFKKVMQEQTLDRSEQRRFQMYYDYFAPSSTNLASYGNYRYPLTKSTVQASDGKTYRWANLVAALENSGLPEIERTIENCLLNLDKKREVTKNG